MHQEVQAVGAAIKQVMREKQMTTKALGEAMEVSEATIKRWVRGHTITLDQVASICKCLEVSFFHLMELAKSPKREELSEEMDKFFSEEPVCYWLYVCMQLRWSQEKISNEFARRSIESHVFYNKLEAKDLIGLDDSDSGYVVFDKEVHNWPRGGHMARVHGLGQSLRFNKAYHSGLDRDPDSYFGVYDHKMSRATYLSFVGQIMKLNLDMSTRARKDEATLVDSQLEQVRIEFYAAKTDTAWETDYWFEGANK